MLDVISLKVALFEKGFPKKLLVNDVNLNIAPATIIALVGESGSGKSLTAYSILNLMPSDNLKIINGKILFKGQNILQLNNDQLRKVRGAEIFMIPQEPLTALNPVLTVGEQIGELFKYHTNLSSKEMNERSISLLEKVKLNNPAERLKSYPHQLSGGERQRVLIAMSIALNPSLIIADEPTTALDVSIQSGILQLFSKIQSEMGKSVIIITHDFGIVRKVAQYIYVMYGGKIVEEGEKDELLNNPIHPYTIGLLKSVPSINSIPKTPLPMIKGYAEKSKHFCPFFERCDLSDAICKEEFQQVRLSEKHSVLCTKAIKC